jgi:predicted nucleic acid-binding protein
MASSRSEYVTDANVLIDLHFGRVLEALFSMPAVFVAPDVIVAELENPNGRSLVRAGLRQESLPGEGVSAAVELMAEDSHISVQDAFALALAERTGRILLTGEKRLRELAQRRSVEVHGTL